MANKVITVTTPSVGTGDTVASYNAYSDQDGALGSLSVAEAAAGKTFSLSDGVVHSVTVKPVGTSSGEYNAPSDPVTVDLSAPATTDIYDLLNAASVTEVVDSTVGANVFSGVSLATSTEQALSGTQSIKYTATAANGTGFPIELNEAKGLKRGQQYIARINHRTGVTSGVNPSLGHYDGHIVGLQDANKVITQSPAQWREETFNNIWWNGLHDKIRMHTILRDSGATIYFDDITFEEVGSQLLPTGANLFPANDAAGDSDTNVVSSVWTGFSGGTAPSASTTSPHSGTYCIKIPKDVATSGVSCKFKVEGLTVDEFYLADYWIKTEGVVTGASINPNNFSIATGHTTWQNKKLVFKATGTTQQISVAVYNTDLTGVYYFDDISVRLLA